MKRKREHPRPLDLKVIYWTLKQEEKCFEQIQNEYMLHNDPRELKRLDPIYFSEYQDFIHPYDQSYDLYRMHDRDPMHDKNKTCPSCLSLIDDKDQNPNRCVCY